MSKKISTDEKLSQLAERYHNGEISQNDFYRFARQIKKPITEELMETWQESKHWIIGITIVIILLVVGGGLFRLATGGEFIPDNAETAEQRESKLYRCAEVYGTTPTYSQQIDGDDRGVCEGFTEQEIEAISQEK